MWYPNGLMMLTTPFWFSVWLCCGNRSIWPGTGNCNESTAFSAKKFVAAWPMEVVTHWICIILWGFRCVHKTKVLIYLFWFGCSRVPKLWTNWIYQLINCFHMLTKIVCFCRYLSYVMDVATPTADCLTLVYDLLLPVVMKGHSKSTLSHQEVKIQSTVWRSCFVFRFQNYPFFD